MEVTPSGSQLPRAQASCYGCIKGEVVLPCPDALDASRTGSTPRISRGARYTTACIRDASRVASVAH